MTPLRFPIMAGLAAILFCMPVHAAAADEAGRYMEQVGNQALAVIADKNLSKDQKQRKLEGVFSTNIDIPWVARFVMGRFWRQASEAQQTRYLTKYREFVTRHYTERFARYTGGYFTVTGVREDGKDEFLVNMQMRSDNSGDEPVLVDYRLRRNGKGFKIFDVIVEGVSMITTQRSEFASVISQHGIDYLIDRLHTMSLPAPEASAKN